MQAQIHVQAHLRGGHAGSHPDLGPANGIVSFALARHRLLAALHDSGVGMAGLCSACHVSLGLEILATGLRLIPKLVEKVETSLLKH